MMKNITLIILSIAISSLALNAQNCEEYVLNYSNELSTASPQWNSAQDQGDGTSGSCFVDPTTDVYYHVVKFNVDANDTYRFQADLDFTGSIHIFSGSFNAADPCLNQVILGFNIFASIDFTWNLLAGVDYFLVTSGLDENELGAFTHTISSQSNFSLNLDVIEQKRFGSSGRINNYANNVDGGLYQSTSFNVTSTDEIDHIFIEGLTLGSPGVVSFSWFIYPDDNGNPAGNPEDGENNHVWSYAANLGAPEVTFVNQNISLNLSAASLSNINLATGKYWLVCFPTVNTFSFGPNTMYAWSNSEGGEGRQISPSGISGFPTNWGVTPEGRAFALGGSFTISAELSQVAQAPTADPGLSICNSGTVADLTANGTDLKWYLTETGGSSLAASTPLEVNTSYWVSQTIAGCESERTEITNFLTVAETPTGNSEQLFCDVNSTVGDLAASADGTIQWYDVPTGGTALASSTVLINNQTYYASSTISNCQSDDRLEVLVTLGSVPEPTLVNDPAELTSICQGSQYEIELSTLPGFDINWYSDATSTQPIFTGNQNPVNTSNLTTESVYVDAENSDGCVSNRIMINYTVVASPQIDSIIDGSGFNFTTGNTGVCAGDSVNFTPFGDFDSFTFFYSDTTSFFGSQSFNLNIVATSNTTGCSVTSVRSINIVNVPESISVSVSQNSLSPSYTGAGVFSWYDCETDSLLQENFSSSPFSPATGSYYLIYDNDFCTRTSQCVDFVRCSDFTITADIEFNENTATATNVTGGTAPYSYQWVGPNGFQNTDNEATITNLENGEYQLIVTDANGCQAIAFKELDFTPTSINFLLTNNFKLYPNPTNNILNIELETSSVVELFNITGKKILETENNLAHQINVSALAQGLYFVKVGEQTLKFVKN